MILTRSGALQGCLNAVFDADPGTARFRFFLTHGEDSVTWTVSLYAPLSFYEITVHRDHLGGAP